MTLEKGGAISEEAARTARLNFFNSLSEKWDYQALLLGHQADDQAETILKRILEGASLAALEGMRSIQPFGNLTIWRPLLTTPKKKIVAWASKAGLLPIDDPTNRDPKYLRSRMRTVIFPQLETSFGKGIAFNLLRMGDFAREVRRYVHRKSPLFSMSGVREGNTVRLDFNPYYPLDSFELKIFLKHFFHEEGVKISYRSLDRIQFLLECKADCKLIDSIFINNGNLLIIKNNKI